MSGVPLVFAALAGALMFPSFRQKSPRSLVSAASKRTFSNARATISVEGSALSKGEGLAAGLLLTFVALKEDPGLGFR